jgi:hypothetical protein
LTPKERITAAFRNEKPDHLPVSPELWDVIPFRVSGRPFYEFGGTSFGKTPLWKAQLEAYKFFNCEAWIPVEPGQSKRQVGMVESTSHFINYQLIVTEVVYKTSKGNLYETKHSCFDYDMWSIKHAVNDIFEDIPKLVNYFIDDPEALDYTVIENAYNVTGDYGICEGIIGNTFYEFLTFFREGGAVQVIFDLYEYPDFFREVQKKYIDYLRGITEQVCLKTSVEGIFLNCGSSTLNIIGPQLFREWDIPVLQAVAEVARRYNKIFHYHLHGKGRLLLDDIVEAGVTMLCPLEAPDKGDFNLKEVKKTFGKKIALKGGIDPFLLRDKSTAEIEKAVKQSIADASDNGGYTLATGDGVLSETPFENIHFMVKTARKYGR